MKTAGWFFLVFGIINFIVFFLAIAAGEPEAAGTKFGGALMLSVLGGFLIYRGNQKEQEQKDKDKWEKNQ